MWPILKETNVVGTKQKAYYLINQALDFWRHPPLTYRTRPAQEVRNDLGGYVSLQSLVRIQTVLAAIEQKLGSGILV